MKIIKSWLKEYIDSGLSDDDLAAKLVETGTEVEKIMQTLDSNIVVAKILKIKPHPNADKLQITSVTDGSDTFTVVCGAKNIKKDMIVPLAKIGTKIGDITISRADLRGIVSEGMLCSERELGVGEDHSGIMELSNDFEIGKPLNEYIPGETIFELEIVPNRGDCQSHVGIAREVGAIVGKSITKEPIELNMSGKKSTEILSVRIESKKCLQYQARILENIKIGQSPEWLQKRLCLLGLKPINNVVDVTNYVMFDLGQPLHAFDYDKVQNKEIVVRLAKAGEKLTTLDEKTVVFSGTELVIADKTAPIAVAGIMGGLDSGISDSTSTIVLESAVFDPKSIRDTSKKLGLKSDASYRYERGIDEGGVEYALNKAAKLIKETAGGSILSGIVKDGAAPEKQSLPIDYANINKILGTSFKEIEIDSFLKKVYFDVQKGTAYIPLYRHDIDVWQDLAEEVGRMYGISNIKPISLPKSKSVRLSPYHKKELIKDKLINIGFTEVYSYSFLSAKDVEAAQVETKGLVEVANPVQPENKYLRSSLIPKLILAIAKNPSFDRTALFEIGNVFSNKDESTNLAVVCAGKQAEKNIEEAKKIIDELLKTKLEIKSLDRDKLKRFKIKKPQVFYFELTISERLIALKLNDSDLRFKIKNETIHYRPVSRFPSVTRDLAFVLDKAIKASDISNDIYEISDKINRVELFDEYTSDKLGADKKNVAYHLYIQDLEKTMNDKEADGIIEQVTNNITKKYKAKLRTD